MISIIAKFIFQLNKITDVFNLSQLVVFVCYVRDMIKEEFLFHKFLTPKNKAIGIKNF